MSGCLFVLFENTSHPQFNHSKNSFPEDAFVHFGSAFGAVGENNIHFLDFKSQFPGGEFHFDLEGIASELDPAEVDSL